MARARLGLAGSVLFSLCSCVAPTPHDDDIVPRSELDGAELAALARDGDFFVSAPVTSETPVSRVGVLLNLKDGAVTEDLLLEVRATDSDEVVTAALVWREDEAMVLNADFTTPTTSVELRVPAQHAHLVHGVAWELFVPSEEGSAGDVELAEEQTSEHALAQWLENGNVRSRQSWGARGPNGCGADSGKYRIAIHHTVTGRTLNGGYARRLRQIQAFHMDSRGYCDIAYHFLVTADGSRWEGRNIGRLGAHVGGQNTGNVGIALVGCFQPGACGGMGGTTMPSEMLNGTARLVRRVARHYGISISSTRVKGHRQWASGTACPGDNVVSQLGTIRSRARNNSYPGPG